MAEGLTWWIIQFGLNFLDFVMIYFISHALMKKYMMVKAQHVALCLFYTIAMAPVFYFFDGYIYRIVATILALFILKAIVKRGSFSDLLTIYAVFLIMTGVIPAPMGAIIWVIIESGEFNQSFIFLIAQSLTTIAIIFVCKKFKWHSLFNRIQSDTVLKLIFYMLSLILLMATFILNFEYQFSYFLFFVIAVVLIGLALFPVMVKLYQDRVKVISTHDSINSLLSTALSMMGETDPEAIKDAFKQHANDLGVDLNQLDMSNTYDELDYMDTMTEKVNTFIDMKMKGQSKKIEVFSDVTYHKDYQDVDFQLAVKWLGILLDNAIDATDTHPIYLYFATTVRRLSIRVANEYIGNEGQDIQVIFEKGYSTKGEGRGIGLHNLYETVTKLGGEIEVDEYYTEAYHCHYLQISIQLKKEDAMD